MYFDFAITGKPGEAAPVSLRTIYFVNADETYNVVKTGVPENDYVALRTFNGKGSVKIEGVDEITVLPGTLLLFRHNEVRRYFCSGEEWTFWWFEFSPGASADFPLNRLLHIGSVKNEEENCKDSLESLKEEGDASRMLASVYFSLLLHKWGAYFDNRDISPYNKAVEKALAYLRSNLSENISVKAMADAAGFCERRFRQIFADVTGLQPRKYIEEMRINMAEELLRNTPFSISEISDKLGYSSQFHFSGAFRKSRGISPSQFRKSM